MTSCIKLTTNVLLLVLCVHVCTAQGGVEQGKSTADSVQQQPASEPAVSGFEGLLSSQLNAKDDSGDYIPCLFSIGALRNLRPTPVVDYLTPAEAESLKTSIIGEVLAQANNGLLQKDGDRSLAGEVSGRDFSSRTRSEVIAEIISILQLHDAEMLKIAQVQEVHKQVQGTETATVLADYERKLNDLKLEGKSSTDAAGQILILNSQFVSQLNDDISKEKAYVAGVQNAMPDATRRVEDAKKQAQELHANVEAFKSQLPKMAAGTATDSLNKKIAENDMAAKEADARAAEFQIELANANSNLAAAQETTTAKTKVAEVIENSKTALLQVSQQQTKVGQAIVDTARTALAAMTRPPDVGCAMSVLSWREVQKAFGRLLANEYIGVQVVVRNLNESKQFLIHDAELAVDTDINGRLSRFYSGRDQKIVRQLSLAQSSYHYRNLIVNILGAVGTVASGAMTFAGPSFKDATGVYNGGFIPAFGKAWPDRGVDQLNLLNDVGFSASTDSKAILVPKSGAAMFVLFVPSKQFEQGWWAQKCAEDIALPISTTAPNSTNPTTNSTLPSTNQPGIDLDRARDKCKSASKFDREAYHDWTPNADNIFKELAFTVVAGTHIAEQSKTTPAIAQIDCPKDQKGNLDFSKQANGSLACKLTGQNLDKVVKIRLHNAADATDNATAEGSASTSGDSTTAAVDLPLAQIGPLEKPDYKVYTVSKEGAEDDGKQTLHFALTPFFVAIKPESVSLEAGKPNSPIQLTGYHLDKLDKQDKIGLDDTPPDAASGYAIKSATLNSVSFEIAPGKQQAPADKSLKVWRISKDDPKNPQSTGLFLKVTGLLPVIPK